MKGLFVSDILRLTSPPLKIVLPAIIMIGYIVMSILYTSPDSEFFSILGLSIMFTVMGCIVGILAISSDDSSGWRRFLFTAPVNIKKYILEKYICMAVMIAVFSVISSVPMIVYLEKTSGLDIKMLLFSITAAIIIVSVMSSLVVPLTYRFNPASGIAVFMIVLVALMMVTVIFSKIAEDPAISVLSGISFLIEADKGILAAVFTVVSAAVLALSGFVSYRIIRKKEV